MKHRRIKVAAAVAAACVLGIGAVAVADNGRRNIRERLTGYEEVPALSTPGVGEFRAAINRAGDRIDWQLTYTGLDANVLQAHIHFENATNNGPVVAFLCSNLPGAPAGTQPCPAPGERLRGTITAAEVGAGATAQGLDAGEIGELVEAIRAGATYVNVHTDTHPGGAIRAQLNGHDHGHHD